jgi:hypothetical protein
MYPFFGSSRTLCCAAFSVAAVPAGFLLSVVLLGLLHLYYIRPARTVARCIVCVYEFTAAAAFHLVYVWLAVRAALYYYLLAALH